MIMQLGSDNVGYVLSNPRANGMLRSGNPWVENEWQFLYFAQDVACILRLYRRQQDSGFAEKHFYSLNDTLTNRQTYYHRKVFVQNGISYTGQQGKFVRKPAYLGCINYEQGNKKNNEVFIHGDMVCFESQLTYIVWRLLKFPQQPLILYLYTR